MPIFLLRSPLPFSIPVRILGDAPGFPKVCMVPSPLGQIPVPYPNITMRLQVQMPNGQWSPVLKLPWKPGTLTLPMP